MQTKKKPQKKDSYIEKASLPDRKVQKDTQLQIETDIKKVLKNTKEHTQPHMFKYNKMNKNNQN